MRLREIRLLGLHREGPEFAQRLLVDLGGMVDHCVRLRQQMLQERAPLSDRMAIGFIQGDVEQCIKTATRYLAKVARSGGRGVPPLGAGPRPASAAGASIAHGCAALSPAIGTRVHKASGAAEATPENRLFHAQQGKPCQR